MSEKKLSADIMELAAKYIPGGVNSPVRAFRAVGGTPPVIARGAGPRLWDVEGNSYVDYVCSWGPLVLGHAHEAVVDALREAVGRGTSYGAPTEAEAKLARTVVDALPGVDMVRFVNSGTEATMSAIRLARAFTGREKVVKFAGGYHGHTDLLLASAGSGVATFSLPGSAGVPEAAVRDTLIAGYNDLYSVRALFEANGGKIAAVIVEPVAGNMGVIPPADGFLQGLRSLTKEQGALLIFDEVITGFRVCWGGAQSLYGVLPDLTCLGKIIGGGLPVGAYGGRRDIMEMVAPLGSVYQAGTLSGNPLAMTAGIATLEVLRGEGTYRRLEELAARLSDGMKRAAEEAGVPVCGTRVGSMMTNFFTDGEVWDYESAMKSDAKKYAGFFWGMMKEGVYFAPSQFEAAFVSLVHREEDIDATVEAAARVMKTLVD